LKNMYQDDDMGTWIGQKIYQYFRVGSLKIDTRISLFQFNELMIDWLHFYIPSSWSWEGFA
jgi:hypothetical protein